MVPEGWDNSPLASLLDRIIDYRGQSVPKAPSGVPLITARNVRKGYLDFSNAEFVDESVFENWMKRGIPQQGDILFTTEAPLGNACRFPENSKYAVGQRTVTLRCNSKLDSNFLLYSILSERGQQLIDLRSSGSTAKGIKSSELKKVKFTYPKSLPEQKKIAKILQTWDRAIATTEKLIDASKQQKKALMQQLLTGKKRFAGFEGEWEEFRLGHVTSIFDGTHSTPKYVDSGVPFYSVEHLTRGNFSKTKYISEEIFTKENKRVKLERNDILMTRIGDIGTAVCLNWNVRASFYVSLALIKSKPDIFNSEFMSYYINSNEFQRELYKRTIHVAFPKKINLGEIANCHVLLPPIHVQEKISKILISADCEIVSLNKKLLHLKQEKKALMQQLLTGKRRVKVDD